MTETITDTGGPGNGVVPKPASIRRLESGLDTVFHAFDQIDGMSEEHRRRVVDDLLGELADAASGAARAGFGSWALSLVLLAAESPPLWADLGAGWVSTLDAAHSAIDAAGSA
ncbi:MAG: hypothetical protein JWP75_2393 [Frondihabitans sp.]|nr:hypothetical protein [Frondihabitans sp.]